MAAAATSASSTVASAAAGGASGARSEEEINRDAIRAAIASLAPGSELDLQASGGSHSYPYTPIHPEGELEPGMMRFRESAWSALGAASGARSGVGAVDTEAVVVRVTIKPDPEGGSDPDEVASLLGSREAAAAVAEATGGTAVFLEPHTKPYAIYVLPRSAPVQGEPFSQPNDGSLAAQSGMFD